MTENEIKSLENQLRSWRPRRPSAALKWRLFLPPSRNATARWLGWLTPAAACAWLVVLSLDSGNGVPSAARRLGMGRATLYKKLAALGITPTQFGSR